MLRIHSALQAGNHPNATTLASELEVTPKTIQRDLEFMRSRFALPIEYDSRKHGYYYSAPVAAFPSIQITEGELVSLAIAEKALQQYRGTTFEKPLVSALKKLEQMLPETISLSLSDAQQAISFKTSVEPIVDLALFDQLARATAASQQLEIAYRKPGQPEPEVRLIDPYHLANINGEWFLFAYDHLRKDLRTFAPARIKSARQTGLTFQRPNSFSIVQRLRDSFGVYSGQGQHHVSIRFTPRVADFVREKIWHQSQTLVEKPSGELELNLHLSSLHEIQRWVLSWGGEAVVLSPPELAQTIRQAAENLLKTHPKKT
jgi:proteasome accessory factor B